MNRQQAMEQARQASLQSWAQAQRRVLQEAADPRNTPVNPAQAAGASGTGSGGAASGTLAIDGSGQVVRFDDYLPVGTPAQLSSSTRCCGTGDGTGRYYALEYRNSSLYLSLVNGSNREIEYYTNLNEVALPSWPCSLYRESNNTLIMVDDKLKKADYQGVIRITLDPDGVSAYGTVVNEVDFEESNSGGILSLFTYNDVVCALKGFWDGSESRKTLGSYNIISDAWTGQKPAYRVQLYKDNQLISTNNWDAISNVVQAADGRVYISCIFNDPVAGTEFGIFEINMTETTVEGGTGYRGNWLKPGYTAENIIVSLFTTK